MLSNLAFEWKRGWSWLSCVRNRSGIYLHTTMVPFEKILKRIFDQDKVSSCLPCTQCSDAKYTIWKWSINNIISWPKTMEFLTSSIKTALSIWEFKTAFLFVFLVSPWVLEDSLFLFFASKQLNVWKKLPKKNERRRAVKSQQLSSWVSFVFQSLLLFLVRSFKEKRKGKNFFVLKLFK